MNKINTPQITVVISTKDRGDAVSAALDSIFSNDFSDCRVVVVDQSTENFTEDALSQYIKNPNFTYIRSNLTGSSAGRNLAIENSDTELIAITDDDCEVSVDWLGNMTRSFEEDNKIGIIYGKVEPGVSTDKNVFVTTFMESSPYISKSIYNKNSLKGLSANMGIRKSLWEQLNGFDTTLGAGARFNSCEETDLNLRALLNGFYISYNPKIIVKHNGYREFSEAQKLIEGYSYGNGALIAKHIKNGQYGMFYILVRQIANWAFGRSWVIANTSKETYRIGRMQSFISGLIKGLLTPVDSNKGHFD